MLSEKNIKNNIQPLALRANRPVETIYREADIESYATMLHRLPLTRFQNLCKSAICTPEEILSDSCKPQLNSREYQHLPRANYVTGRKILANIMSYMNLDGNEFCEMLDISESSLYYWLSGKKDMSIKSLLKIYNLIGDLNINKLAGLDGVPYRGVTHKPYTELYPKMKNNKKARDAVSNYLSTHLSTGEQLSIDVVESPTEEVVDNEAINKQKEVNPTKTSVQLDDAIKETRETSNILGSVTWSEHQLRCLAGISGVSSDKCKKVIDGIKFIKEMVEAFPGE